MTSNRLVRRCQSLGFTVVSVAYDGQVTVPESAGWLECLIARSPVFSKQTLGNLPLLASHPGQAVEVWPGLWLVSLSIFEREHIPITNEFTGLLADAEKKSSVFLDSRRGKMIPDGYPDEADHAAQCAVALLPTASFVDGEWFTLLCEQYQLDRQAALARIDPSVLFSSDEADRIITLIGWMAEDGVDFDHQTNDLQSLGKHLGNSYEEINMLYRLSASLTVDHPEPCLLTQACQELLQVVGFRWVAVQLVDSESRLNELSGKLFIAGQPPCGHPQIQQVGQALFAKHVLTNDPLVIDDTRASSIADLSTLASHLLIIPLIFEGQMIGVLLGADKLYRTQISSIDVKLFSALGHSLSFYLQNTMLYEDTHAMFMGTMHALTKLIDAKDSYTYGHTERVALLAKQLASRLGLDAQSVERVYIASLIHDVGKIGIPEAVLCKPGALTEDEFNLIKKHPEIGAGVLSDIPQMRDLIPGVLYHHERWDGRGYPHQLTGKNIPLLGRLIALADAYDAMSSNRTYRNAMGHDQVLDEIRRCIGTQFDPELAKVFLELDFEPYSDLIRRHKLESNRDAA